MSKNQKVFQNYWRQKLEKTTHSMLKFVTTAYSKAKNSPLAVLIAERSIIELKTKTKFKQTFRKQTVSDFVKTLDKTRS